MGQFLSTNWKILIADDDLIDRENYCRLLNKIASINVTIEEVTTADECIRLLLNHVYDCVLLDYLLPDQTGVELLEYLKKNEPAILEKQSIIMLTGEGDERTAVTAIKLGAYDYLTKKEVNSHRLSTCISSAIEKLNLEKNLNEKIRQNNYLARYDELTETLNRYALMQTLNQKIKYATRHQIIMGLLYIDIDKFKNINDLYGHSIGDKVLCKTIDVIKKNIREDDVIGRVGGDEFVVILTNVKDTFDCGRVAKNLIQKCQNIFSEETYNVSYSIGICCIDQQYLLKPEEYITRADIALYAVKKSGGNDYRYYNDQFQKDHMKRMQTEASIKNAIKTNNFFLVYQPIYQVGDGGEKNIIGFEALLRSNEPGLKNISPAVFIPIAEDMKVINTIGSWVIKQSCNDFSRVIKSLKNDELKLAINLSSLPTL